MKKRNYSFCSSKRLPEDKMTEINGIKIPSMPGSCYHAIICALSETKNQFVPWHRIFSRTETYMVQYGGHEAWDKFKNKGKVKPYQQRIKDNTHTLTRSGTDCYGYRLHERGMAIYFFKDGAMMLTDGEFKKTNSGYKMKFSGDRGLQARYRGTSMTSKEYKRFLDAGYIDASGSILDNKGIRDFRNRVSSSNGVAAPISSTPERIRITITLDENYNQQTAGRLEDLGVMVLESRDNEIDATVNANKVDDVRLDIDVLDVEVMSVAV